MPALPRLLALPDPEVVGDVVAQVERAAQSELAVLRHRSESGQYVSGLGFHEQNLGADADIVINGLLVDFKSTRYVRELSQETLLQLLDYLLLDDEDRYRVDAVGVYLSRRGTLVRWSVPDFLAQLGARRQHLPDLRAAMAELVAGCDVGRAPVGHREEPVVAQLPNRLTPVSSPDTAPYVYRRSPRAGVPRRACTAPPGAPGARPFPIDAACCEPRCELLPAGWPPGAIGAGQPVNCRFHHRAVVRSHFAWPRLRSRPADPEPSQLWPAWIRLTILASSQVAARQVIRPTPGPWSTMAAPTRSTAPFGRARSPAAAVGG